MLLASFLRACAVGLLLSFAGLGHAQGADPEAPARRIGIPQKAIVAVPQQKIHPEAFQVQRVAVRNYIGRPHQVAETELAHATLKPDPQWTKSSRPRGQVIGQQPSEGMVPRGSVVRIEISDGSLVRVPNLRERDVGLAEKIARSGGFDFQVEYRMLAAPEGQVVQQKPQAGAEVERGSRLTVLVARVAPPPPPPPPAEVWVPSFVGQGEDAARGALAKLGEVDKRPALRVRSETQPSSEPASRVVRQAPANQTVPRGTVVTLYVSDGSLVRVPDVKGRDEDGARTRLQDAELRMARTPQVSGQMAPGTVLAQDPRPGAEVPRHSEVRITVAVAPPPPPPPLLVWVPSFIGQHQDTARAGLRNLEGPGAGAVRMVFVRKRSAAPEFQVVGQEPANARVPRGTVVTLQVSDASLVLVPDVREVSEAGAMARLGQLQLRVLRVEQTSDRSRQGLVLAQAPQPGAEVARNSEVRITVAVLAWYEQPWIWLLGGAAGATLALWILRAFRPVPPSPPGSQSPPPEGPPPPDVHVEWRGPPERPAMSAREGQPLRVSLSVSALHFSERPQCVIEQDRSQDAAGQDQQTLAAHQDRTEVSHE